MPKSSQFECEVDGIASNQLRSVWKTRRNDENIRCGDYGDLVGLSVDFGGRCQRQSDIPAGKRCSLPGVKHCWRECFVLSGRR